MIEAHELSKRYGSLEAVRKVSFQVEPGRVVGLLGPNGAGKTTIMKILTGFHFPSGGTATVGGHDVVNDPVSVKRVTGYLPENAPLYPELTVREYLGFIASSRGVPRSARSAALGRAVAQTAIGDVQNRPIGQLSKGYRQRVGLAQAILHDPEILILDEPTTGLDPNQILEIRRVIRELGRHKTVILSTHILQEVEATCDEVMIVNAGEIAARGTSDEIGSRLRGNDVFHVQVKGLSQTDPEVLCKSISGCLSVAVDPGSDDRTGLTISLNRSRDSSEAIFDWAVAAKVKLLTLERERTTLEQVFQELTTQEEAK